MSEATNEGTAVTTDTPLKVSNSAVTTMAVVNVLLLGGILVVLIGLYQRVDQDMAVLKEDMATVVDDLAVVARNAQIDLEDCGPGAARNRAGDCIIG